jgi:membrane-associated protease RseP (regulator of RpoE activity)
MQGLRRNLLPILVGLAAVLVSLASVTVIVDHFRARQAYAFGAFGRGGMMRPGQFGPGALGPGQFGPRQGMPGYPGMMRPGGGFQNRQPGGPGAQQQRPLLGVSGSEDQGGIRVQQVQPGSPADRAGVETGDVIVRADGKDTPNVNALRSAVGAVDASKQQYDLVVKRGGNDQTLKVDAPRQARQQPRQPSGTPQEAPRPGA